jgi:hypothetical protein
MLKPYYRIVRSITANYYHVQRWRWWFPFWTTQYGLSNYHFSVEEAEAYARAGCPGPTVKYLGQL